MTFFLGGGGRKIKDISISIIKGAGKLTLVQIYRDSIKLCWDDLTFFPTKPTSTNFLV